MKTLALTLIGLFLAVNVYAVDFTITLTKEQADAMNVMPNGAQAWIQAAATNKANKMIDRLVLKHSDKQPSKISNAEKIVIFKTIDLVAEKNSRKFR